MDLVGVNEVVEVVLRCFCQWAQTEANTDADLETRLWRVGVPCLSDPFDLLCELDVLRLCVLLGAW